MKSWQFTALLALVIYTLVLRGIPIEHLRYSNTPASETSDTMRAFWQPTLHPLLSENFEVNGKSYDRGSSLWTQPMGRRLCILDVDTRPLNDSNQLWSSGNFSWAGMPSASSGTLNHLLYGRSNFISKSLKRLTPAQPPSMAMTTSSYTRKNFTIAPRTGLRYPQ